MEQMNLNDDIEREETAVRTIRTFGDLDRDSGEEFVGFDDILGEDSDPDSDSHAEETVNLKVRYPSQFKS
jgi:hypothetical protein